MSNQVRHWEKVKEGMKMPVAIVLLGLPDDSFATESDLTVWIYNAGGWIRFKSDSVLDWQKPFE